MLRYFYFIVCIQVCFCSVYVDNNDYEVLDRRVRCRTTNSQKKQTRSPKIAKVVQFDVQKFMRASDSQVLEDQTDNRYRNKKRQNRLLSEDDAFLVEPNEYEKRRIDNTRLNSRSNLDKYQNLRHFDFHSHAFDDKNVEKVSHKHKKASSSLKQNKVNEKIVNDQVKKCSFRNMKIPFFSRSKATVKSKRHKKRRMFCFNCIGKSTTPVIGHTVGISDINTHDYNKDNANIPNSDEKTNTAVKLSKVNKRSYDDLCPKCVKELFFNFKKKTTKKPLNNSQTNLKYESKSSTKKRTIKQKADLSDSLKERYFEEGSERLKRNEHDEIERERRLKELEEVERKIENVHITAASLAFN